MKKYYYSYDGKSRNGPSSFEELKELQITRETLIWHLDLDGWVKASSLPELQDILVAGNTQIHDNFKITEETITAKEIGTTEEKFQNPKVTGNKITIGVLVILFLLFLFLAIYFYKKNTTTSTSVHLDSIENSTNKSVEDGFEQSANHYRNYSADDYRFQREIKQSSHYDHLENISPSEKIKAFIKAEDEEDWNTIAYLFSENVDRYWTLTSPSYKELYDIYHSNWSKTYYRKNDIKSIEESGYNEYFVLLDFTFNNKKSEAIKQVSSSIRFVFNEQGEIIYINEEELDLSDDAFLGKQYYVNQARGLFNRLQINFADLHNKSEDDLIEHLIDLNSYFYESILRYYGIYYKIDIETIFKELMVYQEQYPKRQYKLYDYKITDATADHTVLSFYCDYKLTDKEGKKYSVRNREYLVFNEHGKIIKQYNK